MPQIESKAASTFKKWLFFLVLVFTTVVACLDVNSIKKSVTKSTPGAPAKKATATTIQSSSNKGVTSPKKKSAVATNFRKIRKQVVKKVVLPVITPCKSDTNNHILAFVFLAFMAQMCYAKLSYLKKTSFLVAYGIFIEIIQSFIPWRDCDIADVGADCVGIFIFFGFYLVLKAVTSTKPLAQIAKVSA